MWCIALGPSRIITSFLECLLGKFLCCANYYKLTNLYNKVAYLFQSDPHLAPLFLAWILHVCSQRVSMGKTWWNGWSTPTGDSVCLFLPAAAGANLALLYPWVMHIQCALFMDFICVLSCLSRRLEDNASSHANLPLAGFQISLDVIDVIAQKGSPGPHLTCQRCAPLKLQQLGFFRSSNGHHAEGFFTKYQLVLALLYHHFIALSLKGASEVGKDSRRIEYEPIDDSWNFSRHFLQ